LATVRADLERARVEAEDVNEDPSDVDRVIEQVDELVSDAGVRGRIGAGAGRWVAELDLGWVEGSAGVGGSTDGRGGRLWTS
jgi:hypothetical protein